MNVVHTIISNKYINGASNNELFRFELGIDKCIYSVLYSYFCTFNTRIHVYFVLFTTNLSEKGSHTISKFLSRFVIFPSVSNKLYTLHPHKHWMCQRKRQQEWDKGQGWEWKTRQIVQNRARNKLHTKIFVNMNF